MINGLIENMRTVVAHKALVGRYLRRAIDELVDRAIVHDSSKFSDGEFYPYAANLSRFKAAAYGSSAYRDACQAIAPAIQQHFHENRHHPEHFAAGVTEMTLVDVLEMVCDWIAASQRVPGGQLHLEIQKERFGLDEQLYHIIENTVQMLMETPVSTINATIDLEG